MKLKNCVLVCIVSCSAILFLKGMAFNREAAAKNGSGFQEIKIPEDGAKPIILKLGRRLKITARIKRDTFFKKMCLFANPIVQNPTRRPLYYTYCIAFFDSGKNLIAAMGTGGSSQEVNPGAKSQFGSCFMPLPPADIDKIAFYQARVIESDREVGK